MCMETSNKDKHASKFEPSSILKTRARAGGRSYFSSNNFSDFSPSISTE